MAQTTVTTTTAALKEWAITVEALGKGTQILIMRKGGIREETRHFQIQSNQFLLYPAYEHQKRELLKPEYHGELTKVLEEYSPDDPDMMIRYFARLHEDIEITSEEKLYSLVDDHICTNEFAFERLKWKMKQPLHLPLLRVYALQHPLRVSIQEDHLGCKSWLQLPFEAKKSTMTPVLDETVFMKKVDLIKRKLCG